MAKRIVIKTNGVIEVREFKQGANPPSLFELQQEVRGLIEVVHPKGLPSPYCFVCNEEGIIRGFEENLLGTCLYQAHGYFIAGNIVILKTALTSEGPDIVGLNDRDIDILLPLLAKKNIEMLSFCTNRVFESYEKTLTEYKKALERCGVNG